MPDLAPGRLKGPGCKSGAFCFGLGIQRVSLHLWLEESPMPLNTYLIVLIGVVAAAGATIALFWAMGFNLLWLGLAALVLTLVIRKVKW